MQYYIQAYDFTDENALSRRIEARPAHLQCMRELKQAGHFIMGGAILSDAGAMIGSVVIMDFPEEFMLMKWLETEPYLLEKVWDRVEIKPFRQAEV
ncbi:YciI family protein [Siphonobacter sp.]|uniref:YciI family protein n=1 Tax=Siphonobacter sp. TaxID=1869184 RepID=UPI003B3B9B64